MIVEHTFVTTLESPDAFAAVDELLQSLRFAPVTDDASPTTRRWSRVPASARQARAWAHCPAHLRVDFDRGRLSAALALEINESYERHYHNYALALAAAIEHAGTGFYPADRALAEPARHDLALRRRDTRGLVLLLFVLSVVALFVGLGIYAAATSA